MGIIEDYQAGMKIYDIAKKNDVSLPTIYRTLRKNNMKLKGVNKKLTKEQIKEMIKKYKEQKKVTYKAIAKEYGISVHTFWYYYKGAK